MEIFACIQVGFRTFMKYPSEHIKELCGDFACDGPSEIIAAKVRYLYWSTDEASYAAAYDDGKYKDGTISDIRFYRIWKRGVENTDWELIISDFQFGADMYYPLAMFVEEVGDNNKVTCSFDMNEWQFNTLIGNF